VQISVVTRIKAEPAAVNSRFARADSKKTLSTQYSISHATTDVRIAARVQAWLVNIPHNRAHPATPQAAPEIDRYSTLRLDPNSVSTAFHRRVAENRAAPHTISVNTIHRSRVTPKGLFRNMDLFSLNKIRPTLRDEVGLWAALR